MGTNQTKDFLRSLWGGDHVTAFVGVKSQGGEFKNVAVRTVDEAAQIASCNAEAGHDVYMSCAQFKNHDNRTAMNAHYANAFWLDLDCGADKVATGKGYATKNQARDALLQFARQTGLPNPDAIVDSGNGMHVYWFSNEPISAAKWKMQAGKLKALTHHYGLLADDNRTADMASVLRVPGTSNFKNADNPKQVILRLTNAGRILANPTVLIEQAYAAAGCPQTVAKPKIAGSAAAEPMQIEALAKQIADKHAQLWGGDWQGAVTGSGNLAAVGVVSYPSRSEAEMAMCGHITREALNSGVRDDQLPDTVMKVFERCGLYREEKRRQVENYAIPKVIADALATRDAAQVKVAMVTQSDTGADLITHEPGDILAGRTYARAKRNKLLWVSAAGKWLNWSGDRWSWCHCGEEMAAAKFVAAKILDHAATLFKADSQNPKHKKLMAFATNLQNLKRLEAMITLAKSEEGMTVGHMTQLDSDPWLLGVRNGVVNLKDGGLLSADPTMLITRQAAASFHDDAQCPKWLTFLDQTFEGDQETIDYLQRALGYTLTGLTTEEALFICFGHGANGKSVFANVISTILGDYAQAAPASLVTARRDGDAGPRNDLARLCGARLTSINETQNGDRLDEQVVKMLAGREQISARFLHKEFFDFWPTAKPWLRTNHKPIIVGEDDGIWRRLHLIPFRRKFAEHERDPWLEQKLLEERDGILAWMVRGCLEWKRIGLKPSTTVRRESASYRKESDLLGEFLECRTVVEPEAREDQQTLFATWRLWNDANGTRAGSKASFTRKLAERGYPEVKSNGKRYYAGVKLIAGAA